MKHFLIACFLLTSMAAIAQPDHAQTYASKLSIAELQKHLTIIAGDEMEGRETGTEGQRKAAAYIEAFFSGSGLSKPSALNGYQQYYPLYQDSMISSSLIIGELTGIYGTDYYSPVLANDNAQTISKEIVFAGYGIEDPAYNDYATLDVKGRIVVIFLGEPKQDGKYIVSGTTKNSEWTFPGLSKKISLAASKGAAAVMVINQAMETLNQRQVTNNQKSNVYFPRNIGAQKVNHAVISHAFARHFLGADTDNLIKTANANEPFSKPMYLVKKLPVEFHYSKQRNTIMASNVLGVVEGSDKKDEVVFLTAHYDHLGKRDGKIYYGADDDGSGTVAVMHMAEIFAKAKAEGKGPRRTMVFMTVSGEEKGLWGSEYYSDNPVYPLEKTTVDLNIDMIGRIDTERKKDDTLNYIYVVGHDKISTELPVINEGMNNKYTGLVIDYKFDDPEDPHRIYYRSDHYNFARKGVPVLFFYDGMLKSDYHKPTDTVDKINWDIFLKRTKMIFHTAWEMANRDNMLKRDLPIPTGTR